MLSVLKLQRKPKHFQAFTGLSVAAFHQVLAQVAPAYEAALEKQRDRSDRVRAPGAGRSFSLPLAERLLMALLYLRLYVGQNLLAYLFDLDQSNVCRELRGRLLPILSEVLPTPLTDAPLLASDETDKEKTPFSGKKRRRINSLKELLEAHPEIEELLTDTSEQPIPQPTDKLKRKQCFSGKKQDHTVKTQITATRRCILHVFGSLPGSLADQTIIGASGVVSAIPPGVVVRVDKGYQGVAKRHPDKAIESPIKQQRGKRVTLLGQAYNQMLSSLRIYVEHHFARLKCFGILRQQYRGHFEEHQAIFCVVAGLLNFRATGSFELA
jgi:hypothetical protein